METSMMPHSPSCWVLGVDVMLCVPQMVIQPLVSFSSARISWLWQPVFHHWRITALSSSFRMIHAQLYS